MASASQIAAALADAQAKQALADAAAATYTAKVNELAALGGSPRERAQQIAGEIQARMVAAAYMMPPYIGIAWAYGFNGAQSLITPVASTIAAEIESYRLAMIEYRTAYLRYPELAALRTSYPSVDAVYHPVANANSSCLIEVTEQQGIINLTTAAANAAAVQDPATQAGQVELIRLRQLVQADPNYYISGGIYDDYWNRFSGYSFTQAMNRLFEYVNYTDNRSSYYVLYDYYIDKLAKTDTATTAWNYYNSLTLDAPVLNQRTHYANGGVTVSAIPTISVFNATSPPTAGSLTFTPSGGVAVGGIASAIPYLVWQQGNHVISYNGNGGVTVGGTASIPGTTGSGGAVVITIHGTLTGGGGEAAVVLADLTLIDSTLTGPGGSSGEVTGTIEADLTLVGSALTDGTVEEVTGTIEADLTLVGSALTDGTVEEVTGTIEADLTNLSSAILSDDYVPPASNGTIEADLTAIRCIMFEEGFEPIQVDGTIDDAPLTLIDAILEGDTSDHIAGQLTLIEALMSGGQIIEGEIDADLTLVESVMTVEDNRLGRFRAKLTKITSNIKGGMFGVKAELPLLDSSLMANASASCVLRVALPRIEAKFTGNFNLAARLTRLGSSVNARAGKSATVDAQLSLLGSQIAGNAAITATLPLISSTAVALSGDLANIAASLTAVDASLNPGNMIYAVSPKISSTLTVRPIRYGKITAKLTTLTGDVDGIAYSELPEITALLPLVGANLSDNPSGFTPVTGTVAAGMKTIGAQLQALQGRGSTVSAKLPRMTSSITAKRGTSATCNAVMPGVIRAKITAKRGTRGAISAKLKIPTSRIV